MKSQLLRTHQNTYRLQSKQPFDMSKVKIHLKNIMELNLKEVEYSDQEVDALLLTLVGEIKAAIKSENFDRYRIVVMAFMGEKNMQGLHVYHSFVWNQDKDKYVDHLFETPGFYVFVVVYGIYFE